MDGKKTYDGIAKTLHWLLAVLIFAVLFFGLGLEDVGKQERLGRLVFHSGLGLTVLVLALYRIYWRRKNPPPALPDAMSPRMKTLATRNTQLLYGLMIYQPTLGLLHAATYVGGEIKPFGLFSVTALLPSSEIVTKVFHVMHALGAFLLIFSLLVHILAAFKHLAVDKDRVFQRMLPFGKG